MSFAATRKKKKTFNKIKDKQVPHTVLQKLSPKSLTSPLGQDLNLKCFITFKALKFNQLSYIGIGTGICYSGQRPSTGTSKVIQRRQKKEGKKEIK